MESHFATLDWIVLVAYFVGTMSIGFYFYYQDKSRSMEGFTVASRSLPGWVCGLSIFATFLSSISFLAMPGKSFSSNWNSFVFSLSLPIAAWVAVKWFIPYYRQSNEISAYAHLENRFGVWARIYASFFYLLMQLARMGIVMFLMGLPLNVLLGWNTTHIILVTGVSVTVYSMLGGIVAVIWADALQAIVLMAGAVGCVFLMFLNMPESPAQVIEIASREGKFSLGDFGTSLTDATFWVVLTYGFFINLTNFGIDQNYVQRYLAASSDREARGSLWFGALLYVPISALFFFIGSLLFVFYESHPEDLVEIRGIVAAKQLAEAKVFPDSEEYEAQLKKTVDQLNSAQLGDSVFPHFIGKHLPAGMTGLLIAAIFAAAMSTISTGLNSSATLLMNDYFKRFFFPAASERQQMLVLYASTLVLGALATIVALALIGQSGNLLDVWWKLASILSGGMLGLFLLGRISRVGNPAAVTAVLIGTLVFTWATFSPTWGKLDGTVSVEHGASDVIGKNADFAKTLKSGDQIEINHHDYNIQSVADDGQRLSLVAPFDQESMSGVTVYQVNIWSKFRSHFHTYLIIVIGAMTILLVGILVGKLSSNSEA